MSVEGHYLRLLNWKLTDEETLAEVKILRQEVAEMMADESLRDHLIASEEYPEAFEKWKAIEELIDSASNERILDAVFRVRRGAANWFHREVEGHIFASMLND